MADEKVYRVRDDEGKIVGGVTAHAPGIHAGDNLAGVSGRDAIDAEGTAKALGSGAGTSLEALGAPLTAAGESEGDRLLRGGGATPPLVPPAADAPERQRNATDDRRN